MTTDNSTIASLLTPLAPGGIAVVALHGPDTDRILGKILRRPEGLPQSCGTGVSPVDRNEQGGTGISPPDHRPVFRQLLDGDAVLDDVVVVRIPRGGTPAAEINTHGGVRIAQRTLMLLKCHGAQVVDAGQFVLRCIPADPIEYDCDQALLHTCSRRLIQWLLTQRRSLPSFFRRLAALDPTQQAAFRERSRIAVRLIHGLHVAILGPPNSGKSTLSNRLIGSDRVITSDRPGTTRDWVSETALIRGWPIILTDTAGIRDTCCDIEAEAIRRARRRAELADLVVIILDATTTPNEQLAALRAILGSTERASGGGGVNECGTGVSPVSHHNPSDSDEVPAAPRCPGALIDSEPPGSGRPRIIVLNKCDATDRAAATKAAGSRSPTEDQQRESLAHMPISALTGTGVDDLESRIHTMLGLDRLEDNLPTAFLPHQLR